jgi:hypothetical protein
MFTKGTARENDGRSGIGVTVDGHVATVESQNEPFPFVHTSRYDFNNANLTIGAAYWTGLVERYLE